MILTIDPIGSGLNNQRICLVGLFVMARERGALVRLPSETIDYTPRGQKVRVQETIPLWDLFDEGALMASVAGLTTAAPADETVVMQDAFKQGGAAIRAQGPTGFPAKTLLSLRAARPLAEMARNLSAWIGSKRAVPVQFRIERDWRAYLANKRPDLPPEVHQASRPEGLFSKLRATPDLDDVDVLWACCDDGDLVETADEIKDLGKRFGFEVWFKSDLPKQIALPERVSQRAMVDFTICLLAPLYIGLSASTFSSLIAMTNTWEGRPRKVLYFDRPDKAELV